MWSVLVVPLRPRVVPGIDWKQHSACTMSISCRYTSMRKCRYFAILCTVPCSSFFAEEDASSIVENTSLVLVWSLPNVTPSARCKRHLKVTKARFRDVVLRRDCCVKCPLHFGSGCCLRGNTTVEIIACARWSCLAPDRHQCSLVFRSVSKRLDEGHLPALGAAINACSRGHTIYFAFNVEGLFKG